MEVYFEPVALSLIAPQILTFISPLDIEFFFFFFLGPNPQHMEVPRLGIKSATAAGLCHSQSCVGSDPHLQPTPQPTATQNP